MGHSHGLRAGTRYAFSRGFKKHGAIPMTVYLRQYRVGDIVDIVVNGAVQKGMPYKFYHGKTGVVNNVTKSAVGVTVHKPVGNRYLEKRINVRIEHVRHSRSRDGFLTRVKDNARKQREAKEKGEKICLKRQPVMPRLAHRVEMKAAQGEANLPETIVPVAYETTI